MKPFYINLPFIVFILFLLFLSFPANAQIDDKLAIRAIVGEAANQGYQGMLALASGIRNRGTLRGVLGLNAQHADREPAYIWDMAKRAWEESRSHRIHAGTHWENIKAFGRPYWADSMIEVYRYKDHVFYKEKE